MVVVVDYTDSSDGIYHDDDSRLKMMDGSNYLDSPVTMTQAKEYPEEAAGIVEVQMVPNKK